MRRPCLHSPAIVVVLIAFGTAVAGQSPPATTFEVALVKPNRSGVRSASMATGVVVDETGLAGAFDLTLQWNDEQGPSIFTAIQEQLGLRLLSEKRPVDVMVIDSVERPAPD